MAAVAAELSVSGTGTGGGAAGATTPNVKVKPKAKKGAEGEASSHDSMSTSMSMTQLRRLHQDICNELNVDDSTAGLSWNSYELVSNSFTLEGNPMHWVGLALYVECRQSLTPTVGQSDVIEGNCVSLTKLLKLCNISLYDFFHKIKTWLVMTNKKEDFRKKIEKVEGNFNVSSVLFKKLETIFYDIFRPTAPSDTPKPSKSNKKLKSTNCTSSSLFEFTWCLFICVKCEFPDLSDNLVNMYHMMLCCINLIVSNACVAQRKDIINSDKANKYGLPTNWAKINTTEPPCIISQLCENHSSSEVEVKSMKQYKFKSILDEFFRKKYLKGNYQNFMGLIDPAYFNSNLKSLNNTYGTYMLTVGEFDERVILGGLDEISKVIAAYESEKKATLVRDTPLSGRQHLPNKNDELTPISMVIQSIEKFNSYLFGHSNSPSPVLLDLFEKCKENPLENIVKRQKMMGAQFLIAYSALSSEDMAGNRLNLIEVFYYRLLEDIIKEEQRRKPHINVQWLFESDIFHKVLFACCTDIVIYTYNSYNVRFPWVLECYQLFAFDFYKIIELIVITTKERLSRDIVKHLNTIEEHVLEILAWKSTSPIWGKISQLNQGIPRWSQVRIPENNSTPVQPDRETQRRQPSTSTEYFMPSGSESPARRQLFRDASIRPGQSLLNSNLNTEDAPNGENSNVQPRRRVTRASSLELFFRKFYYLCFIRLQNLCTNLGLTDEELMTKIWNLLEHNIVHEPSLMKDRHLDQILMCTIYAMCKVCDLPENRVERTFREIMRCYRLQPQAKNNIYRDVLLGEADDSENVAPHTTPNRVSNQQKRGDLIQFYNSVYIISMRNHVFLLSGRMNAEIPPLSPLPDISRGGAAGTALASEAHRVSDHCSLYVYPLNTSLSNEQSLNTFQFNLNSTQDLHNINQLMSQETIKRLFVPVDSPMDSPQDKKPRIV